MPRRVFFSFHHRGDIWRVGQVRNSWLTQNGESSTFLDAAAWEKVKRNGSAAVRSWIDRELSGTSVTVVLIGTETASRPYVRYEIDQSLKRKKGLLGIHIHGLKNRIGETSAKGRNPLEDFIVQEKNESFLGFEWKSEKRASDIFRTFDWVWDNGRGNMVEWIEEAARRAGR